MRPFDSSYDRGISRASALADEVLAGLQLGSIIDYEEAEVLDDLGWEALKKGLARRGLAIQESPGDGWEVVTAD